MQSQTKLPHHPRPCLEDEHSADGEERILEKGSVLSNESFLSKLEDEMLTSTCSEVTPQELERMDASKPPLLRTAPTGRAVLAMLFCVLADSMNVLCAFPNYPLMVSPGAHPDSFPDTDPFDFSAAQHMITTASSGGAFLGYLGAGWLSGRVGQRRLVLVNMFGSVIFTLAKYAAKHDYWTFVALAFANGCFSSTWAVALGYMAELFIKDRAKGDAHMGHVNAVGVIGRTTGGLLAVITPNRLFFPLISGAFISTTGLLVAYLYLPDARQLLEEPGRGQSEIADNKASDCDADPSTKPPEKLHTVTLFNVLCGLLIDNAGSMGLLSFSLSPLMFKTFYLDFVEDGKAPIMSEQTYRILYSTTGACIAVGAAISPWLFKKLGVAVSCVFANLTTAGFTISLLYIALLEPVTRTTFAVYTAVLYFGFALSMVSNVSAGPMLDRLTPLKQKGLVQGINAAILDGAYAVCPILYALIVDRFGIAVALWISTGLCCLAALVNLPLVFHPLLKKLAGEIEDKEGPHGDARTARISSYGLSAMRRSSYLSP